MQPLISTQALADKLARPDARDRLRLFDATVHLQSAPQTAAPPLLQAA